MNPDNEDSIHDFLQSQITDTPLSLNNELSNRGVKFNHRDDFEEIRTFIDEFIDGNMLIVILYCRVLEVLEKQQSYFRYMTTC
jgi:hypothetical protein